MAPVVPRTGGPAGGPGLRQASSAVRARERRVRPQEQVQRKSQDPKSNERTALLFEVTACRAAAVAARGLHVPGRSLTHTRMHNTYGVERSAVGALGVYSQKIAKFGKILRYFRIFVKKMLIFAKIADFLQNFAKFLKI